ncbi:MAG: tRNA pseudouridine(55) synthase TruB [Acidobacteria bacterium]|nr:MAG: tRNA pseudouridine(55) synthase TruB [Acidobacteriota bacterium]
MSRRRPSRWHGLLPVHKKTGPTSHDIVDIARRSLKERRIGHTGTLDPMAEGLLLLCVGRATRLQQYLLKWDKAYRGRVRLGWETDTYDAEGERVGDAKQPETLSHDQISELEEKFSGSFDQMPPAYSAKKVGGKKLYELARKGQDVEITPKTVQVHSLHLQQEDTENLVVEVETESGFYVRSLAHDIGQELGWGAHLRRLERTRIGPFRVEEAISQDELEKAPNPESIIEGPHWIPLGKIPLPFPSVDINPTAGARFIHGQEVVVLRSEAEIFEDKGPVAVRRGDELLGIGEVISIIARGRTITIRPSLVLAEQSS